MPHQYDCPDCEETFTEDTAEGLIKRAAAHHHDHHGGPAEMTPEMEAAIRNSMVKT